MKNIDTIRRVGYEGRPNPSASNAKEIRLPIQLP
jgi:hypothetical protein